MRSVVAGLVLAAVVLGSPAYSRAEQESPGAEFGYAIGAAAANLVYIPAKAIVAAGGLAVGSVCAVLTGGSIRAAYAVWVPAASGTYYLTPEHIAGTAPIAFFGDDYADTMIGAPDAGASYDVMYKSM